MRSERLTTNQHAVLWLLQRFETGTCETGFRRLGWTPPDGANPLRITCPVQVLRSCLARGFVEMVGKTARLTERGQERAAAFYVRPVSVQRATLPNEVQWLTDAQLAAVEPWYPDTYRPRLDDRKILSGIVHVIRHGKMWGQVPPECGQELQVYRRFLKWSKSGVLDAVFAHLRTRRADGSICLVITPEMLLRHPGTRQGVMAGWYPSILAPEELAA